MTAVVVGLALVVALLAALTVGLLRAHADVLRALHELGVGLDGADPVAAAVRHGRPGISTRSGVPSPGAGGIVLADEPITGTTPDGGTIVVALTPRPHATVVAFLSTGCTTCSHFWAALAGELDLPVHPAEVVIVTRGPEHESPAEVARLAPVGLPTVQSAEAWSRFAVPGSPYFALVDGGSGQIVGEGTATTWEHVVGLLRRAVADGGVDLGASSASVTRPAVDDAAARERRVEGDLSAEGITPTHPSRYPRQPMSHASPPPGPPDADD